MRTRNWIQFAVLGLFIVSLFGCDGPKNVVDSSKKVGMTAAERKDKRGE